MTPFLREIQPMLQRIVSPEMTLRIDVSDEQLVARIDPRQFTASLLNLSANARDAMQPGGTLTIRVGREGAGRLRIDVSDDGCGMGAQVLARATDPFFTTKAVGSGSGLGLSMVDGFVRQSGGELRLRSEPGRGTTVTLILPAIAD